MIGLHLEQLKHNNDYCLGIQKQCLKNADF